MARGGASISNFSSGVHNTEHLHATTIQNQEEMTAEGEHQKALTGSMEISGSSAVVRTFGGVSYWDTSSMNEFRVFFVLGGPGAGKGTQSSFLKEQYPCVHLSVGDLLREETAKSDSPNGSLISECLKEGKIVPVEISLSLLQNAMENAASEKGKELFFLVDGFPRNFDNLEGWNRCMKGVSSVWGVLMFTCPLDVLEQRILSRAETSGRSDDNLKSAQKRFRTFEEQTMPVVDTLREVQELLEETDQMPVSVADIQGNQKIDEVWADTQEIMNSFLANDVWSANARLMEAIESGDEETYGKMCSYLDDDETMKQHEGESGKAEISDAAILFSSGTKATTSYQRKIGDEMVKESRTWSFDGGDRKSVV